MPSALCSLEDRGPYSSHREVISLGVLPPTWPTSDLQNPRLTERSPGATPGQNPPLLVCPEVQGPTRSLLGTQLHAAAETLVKMEPIVESDWASHCFANSRTSGQLPSEPAFLCCSLIKPQSYTTGDNGMVECSLELFYFMES